MGPIAAGALGVVTGIGAAFLSELTFPYSDQPPSPGRPWGGLTNSEVLANQQRGEGVAVLTAALGAGVYFTSKTSTGRAFAGGLAAASAFSFYMYKKAELPA